MTNMRYIVIFLIVGSVLLSACRGTRPQALPPDEFVFNPDGNGPELEISFTMGDAHNHPLMVIWAEDENGQFIQTLYLAESISTGVFLHGDMSSGKWMPAVVKRPAALPYWTHRSGNKEKIEAGLKENDKLVPDAFTGPTPPANFVMSVKMNNDEHRVFRLYFEINQTWDWNEYWTNNKFPDDEDYKTSSQPALVYTTLINLDDPQSEYSFMLLGHSHWSGRTGELFTDLSTMTTALDIAREIKVRVGC
jgi:hypothetical protein